jgi:hypothetical protein
MPLHRFLLASLLTALIAASTRAGAQEASPISAPLLPTPPDLAPTPVLKVASPPPAGSAARPGASLAPRAAELDRGAVDRLRLDATPPPRVGQRSWYGWETLTVYGVSAAFLAGSIAATTQGATNPATTSFGVIGFTGLPLGGAVVHWANGNVAKGFGSIGLSMVSTLATAGIGAGIGYLSPASHRQDGAVVITFGGMIGAGVGLMAAMAVDVSLLSYRDRPAPSAAGHRPTWSMIPTVLHVDRSGAVLGLAGTL